MAFAKEMESAYIKLLETLIKIAEANKGFPTSGNDKDEGSDAGVDNRFLDAEGLMRKFSGHAASSLYLFRSTTLRDVKVTADGISFFDTASINVLGRAALETFLVFHHVFIAPRSDDEKDLRYYSWLLASYLDRQKFPAQSDAGKQILKEDKGKIEKIKGKLNANQSFQLVTKRQKKNLFTKGYWRLCSWKELGLEAGLSNILVEQFYSHLCAYAHSGCQSAQQISNQETAKDQKATCVASMKLIMIAMANMICSYSELFEKSKTVLQNDNDALSLVNQWIEIGASLQNEFQGTH